jgi:alpha,alpha-trehalose phosphorylase
MYMVPYFLLTNPMQAKRLLLHRYHGLQEARQEARNLGHPRGAKYPWRTINGTEASPYFPAGSAQYHINAIIAYQFIQYHLLTKDEAFLLDYGFEVLYDTAQIYLEIGYHTDDGFEILGVTGPDEYTALVDNNYYTNSMAQYHMEYLVRFFEQYEARLRPGFDPSVVNECRKAAKRMVLRFDETRNIHPQDDSFLRKKPVDLATWKRPLLLHYHPMTIYRHQVCKQADVIASYLLLDNVPEDVMRDSLNFYERVTTHDSSLSKCIFSIQHLRVGQQDIGEAYFHEQLQIDFDNTYGNTGHGLHLANMGGTYLVLVLGFLGLRWNDEGLAIRPKLPSGVRRIQAPIHYQGGIVAFDITPSRITIETDNTVLVQVDGTDYLVQERTSIPRS